jgi:uncharacterized DUF497 family protein
MIIVFDVAKSIKNIRERSLPFEEAHNFDWESATYIHDKRKNYPEDRYIAIGYLGTRLHVICFTPITDGLRIISFRKANHREAKKYEKETVNQ